MNCFEHNDLLIYQDKEGNIIVDAIYKDETLWLTQKAMSKVFDCSTDNISLHLKNIFKDKELNENSVTEESSITASDGKKYKTKMYNLDAILQICSLQPQLTIIQNQLKLIHFLKSFKISFIMPFLVIQQRN